MITRLYFFLSIVISVKEFNSPYKIEKLIQRLFVSHSNVKSTLITDVYVKITLNNNQNAIAVSDRRL